ncbi:MAG: 1-deoxy-D-xylulose-5-phosphate reductoisomerase [Muribaculaceae bacterium]|nr:1-deoxy-D-xylulose-5-phosphate reductoisomerase [Muribaculaceae bacterium]
MKHIAIMGSTGSIGTQTLDIISEHPDRFRADVLTAGSNWQLLAQQAIRFKPRKVVIADDTHYENLSEALHGTGIQVEAGRKAVEQAGCDNNTDIVVAALVGYAGLLPTLNAIRNGKCIALANKETLVVAGSIMTAEAEYHDVALRPVDSEHSAIFQCLQGEEMNAVRRIFLTASGGPFRTLSKSQLEDVTVEQALNHPNWSMGAKVTIDSASMMNKGFEMIEARWLFNTPPERIEVVVHPQSIVHSMVEFVDGAVKAQLGLPDMHLPIQYALSYPERLPLNSRPMNVMDFANLEFAKPDMEKFPLLEMAYDAISAGGNRPCILNAANEVAVKAFLNKQIKFVQMPEIASYTIRTVAHISHPDLDDLIQTHDEATAVAKEYVSTLKSTHV